MSYNKIMATTLLIVWILAGVYYSYLFIQKHKTQKTITIDNFNTAINELLKEPWLDLSVTKIFTAEQLTGTGKISRQTWYVTSNIESDEYPGYYYGFRINRTLSLFNHIDWSCMSQYHPIKMNKKLNPNNLINYFDYCDNISDEDLSKWPKTRSITIRRLKDREKLVNLIKKIQQQTAYLFKTK